MAYEAQLAANHGSLHIIEAIFTDLHEIDTHSHALPCPRLRCRALPHVRRRSRPVEPCCGARKTFVDGVSSYGPAGPSLWHGITHVEDRTCGRAVRSDSLFRGLRVAPGAPEVVARWSWSSRSWSSSWWCSRCHSSSTDLKAKPIASRQRRGAVALAIRHAR